MLTNEADRGRWAGGAAPGARATNPGVLANTAAYRRRRAWLDEVLAYLDGNRRAAGRAARRHLPGVRYTPARGHLPGLAGLPRSTCRLPGELFLERAGVALVDGPEFGAAGRGHVRFNFATPRPVLRPGAGADGRGDALEAQAAADDLLHDLRGAAVDGLDAASRARPWRPGTPSCSRSRRAAAGSGR